MKMNIFDEFKIYLSRKLEPYAVFLSQYKKNAVILYDGNEVYHSVLFCDFSILFREDEYLFEISSRGLFIYCWHTYNAVSWSKDGSLCSVSISINSSENKIGFREAKLVIDIENKLFTLIPLAGAREYKVKFADNSIEISTDKIDGNKEYIEILNKKTDIGIFKWLPLPEINKARELYNTGYFGNLSGYKREERNIYFKNTKNEWPYNEI
jgi:hypothetical protein